MHQWPAKKHYGHFSDDLTQKSSNAMQIFSSEITQKSLCSILSGTLALILTMNQFILLKAMLTEALNL